MPSPLSFLIIVIASSKFAQLATSPPPLIAVQTAANVSCQFAFASCAAVSSSTSSLSNSLAVGFVMALGLSVSLGEKMTLSKVFLQLLMSSRSVIGLNENEREHERLAS